MQIHRAIGAAMAVVTIGCSQPTASGGVKPEVITALPRQLSTAEQAIARSTPDFAVALLKAVNTTFTDSNVFISPLSASMALGMTLNGTGGDTHTEMRSALGLPDRSLAELNAGYQSLIALLTGLDRTVEFRIANSIWYDQAFGPAIEPAFLSDTKQYFGAQVAGLDFRAAQAPATINDWVNSSTNGKIERIIDRIPDEMVMYLINAIYFKGAWRDAFDPKQTANAPFTTHTGQQVTVPTMTRKGGFRSGTTAGTTVVELPYGGDAFVMTIALPPEGTPINAWVAGLTSDAWTDLASGLTASTFDLYLPKFKLTWEDKLNEELKAMGMQKAFIGGVADFSRLSRTQGDRLFISEVKQKTFVDVNEEGTEAAAVTSVGIGVTSLPPSIRINRPFVFVIREKLSGTVLFMGKIVRPVTG